LVDAGAERSPCETTTALAVVTRRQTHWESQQGKIAEIRSASRRSDDLVICTYQQMLIMLCEESGERSWLSRRALIGAQRRSCGQVLLHRASVTEFKCDVVHACDYENGSEERLLSQGCDIRLAAIFTCWSFPPLKKSVEHYPAGAKWGVPPASAKAANPHLTPATP
jgi:hypothetical protein